MAAPHGATATSNGFDGEISGLGLADVIQMNVHSRFSGCLAVQYEDRAGSIFFRDGQIVHAEQGGRGGEEAFCDVLAWPAGRFTLHANVSSTRATIQKPWEHLLLDAVRVIDEHRAGKRTEPAAAVAADATPSRGPSARERLQRVPGVVGLIVQSKDGARVGGEEGYAPDVLAAQTSYVAAWGARLGAVFGAGELRAAAVEGTAHHLLLIATKNHHLGVRVDRTAAVGAVDREIWRVLGGER